MVDVASDSLLGVPPAMVRALAELLSYETEGEGDVLDDVADNWAAEEDMPFGADAGRELCPRGSPNSPPASTPPPSPASTSGLS